jgi:hypothetical protein
MPTELSKAVFTERATHWARRVGVEFGETRLNEWIKQGLVEEGARRGNIGTRPVFRFGARHYRRVLQIILLYGRGIKDKNAVLVQLFLKGYGVRVFEVREPLRLELRRHRKRLNALVRSTRLDRSGDIPPKHMQSLVRSLGPADRRLADAEVVPAPTELVSLVRIARSPDPQTSSRAPPVGNSILSAVVPLLAGMLADDPEFPSPFEEIIMTASDEDYLEARGLFIVFKSNRSLSAVLLDAIQTVSYDACDGAVDAIQIALAQPEFSCTNFLTALRTIYLKKTRRRMWTVW